jgi:outer membrane protein assembly factor BamB
MLSSTDTRYRTALNVALASGVLSLLICALLLYDFSRRQLKDPFEDATLSALKTALTVQSDNAELRKQIGQIDLQVRQEYFRQKAFAAAGAGLLLGSLGVCLIAARYAAALRRKLPSPASQTAAADNTELVASMNARWAVIVVGLTVLGAAVGLILTTQSNLPRTETQIAALLKPKPSEERPKVESPPPARKEAPPSEKSQPQPQPREKPRVEEVAKVSEKPLSEKSQPEKQPKEKPSAKTPTSTEPSPTAPPPLSEEQLERMWPRFRGPGGLGVSRFANIPKTWNAAKGENIVWKVPIPLPGNSSPVVCGERIFLSGATEKNRKVFCYAASDGALLWEREVHGTPESTAKPPEVNRETGYASPTPATDGHSLFAMFANGDIAAYDFDGKLVWSRSLGMPDSSYGYASSLCVYKKLLIVQFDQGDQKKPKSKLLALDSASGNTVWEVAREVPASWASPIVVHAAGVDQLITAANPWVIAYNPDDGKEEIWRAKCLPSDVGPSPTFCDGIVYVASQMTNVAAIRPDGKGDVTKTHVLWKGEDNLPDTCSPLATEKYVFSLSTEGTLTCYDAKKGDNLWERDFPGIVFTASPSLVGNYVYLIGNGNKGGMCYAIEPGEDDGKVVGEGELEDLVFASPAFQDGRMYVRGEHSLFCIGEKK